MIKKIAITGMLAVSVSLCACGQSGYGSSTSSASKVTKTKAVEATSKLPETAVEQISKQALAQVKVGTAPCAFDSVDGNYSPARAALDKSHAHVFRGWALNEDRQVPKEIEFVLQGTESFAIPAKSGVDRPDVGDYFKDARLNGAGFNFSTTLKAIPAGVYRVLLVTQFKGASYGCETKKDVTVV